MCFLGSESLIHGNSINLLLDSLQLTLINSKASPTIKSPTTALIISRRFRCSGVARDMLASKCDEGEMNQAKTGKPVKLWAKVARPSRVPVI